MSLRFLSSENIDGNIAAGEGTFVRGSSGFAIRLDSANSSTDNDLRFAKGGVDYGAIQTGGGSNDLEFYVHSGSSWIESFRVQRSTGNVGIGLSPASSVVLDVKEPDSSNDLILGLTAGTGARAQIRSVVQSANTESAISFHTTLSSSTQEKLRILATGALSVGNSGTNYGTSGQVLTSTGNAVPQWTTPTTGTITGSGTANKVTKFTAATAVGDGPITFSSNDSTFAGDVELKSDAGNATKYLRIWNEGTAANDDAVLSWTAQASRTYSMGIHRDSGNLVITNADASVASGDILNISNSGNASFEGDITSKGLTVDYTGNRTGDAGILVTNDNSDWGIKVDKDGTADYGILSQTDGENAIVVRNAAGVNKIQLQGDGDASFAGTISAVGASTFTLNDGIFIKAVNGTNNVAATNVWGYGLYEGASKLGEISLVRDGTNSQMYMGTTGANQVLRIGSANKVTALTIDASQNATFAGNVTVGNNGNINIPTASSGNANLNFDGSDFKITSNSSSANLKLETNSTTRLTINSSGTVLIGNTAPLISETLNVTGSGIMVEQGDGGVATLLGAFGSSDGIVGTYTNSHFHIRTNNNNRITVLNGGNVGIGTTSPNYKLEVNGSLRASSNIYAISTYALVLDSNSGSGPQLTFGSTSDNDSFGRIAQHSSKFQFITQSRTFEWLNGSSSLMTLQTGGNLGIGTTSPGNKLQVVGDITIGSGTVNEAVRTMLTGGTLVLQSTDANHRIIIRGTQNTSGTVTGNSNNMDFYEFGGYNFYTGVNTGTGARVSALHIDSSGNVGINTTTPAHKLSVLGDQLIFGDLLLEGSANSFRTISMNTSDGSDNQTLSLCGGATASSARGARVEIKGNETGGDVNIIAGNVSTGDIDFYTANSSRMIINNAGNVGIGYTNPGSKLSVNGDGGFVSNSSSRVLYLTQQAVDSGNIIQFLDQSGNNVWEVVGRNNQFYIYNNNVGQHSFYVNPSTNNVSIKQVTSSYSLDVNGTIRASADVIAYSDRRVKENIKTIDNALDKVTKLRGVSYNRKDIEDKSTKIGVIAQEVKDILPEVVEQDLEDKYSVAYGNMAGVFIEAIKELEARVKELEKKQ